MTLQQQAPNSAPGQNSFDGSAGGDVNMPQRLGELLVSEKLISAEQLEDAVEAQCLYGGRLGTSLIELGFLDEEEIARTLSRKLHLPYIEPGLLMKIPPEVISLVPQKLAWKHLVIPCRLEKKRLYLAMSDPTNLTIIDALAFRLGFIIVPVVVPEIRLMLALQKYYQLELSPRFHTLSQNLVLRKKQAKKEESRTKQKKVAAKSKSSAEKKKLKVDPVPEPEETIFEVSEEDIIDETESAETQWPLLGERESLDNLTDEEYQKLINMPEHLRLGPAEEEAQAGADRQVTAEVARLKAGEQHPFALFCKSLTDAENRDDIANAIIDYLAPQSPGAALLMVKGGEAMGWRASANGETLADFDQLQIPLDQPSALQTVATSNSYYLGPLQKEANNVMLSSYFGHQIPATVLLVPLLLRNRLVTILYLQDDSDRIQERLPEYQKLVSKASMAFEMLILKNKIQMG